MLGISALLFALLVPGSADAAPLQEVQLLTPLRVGEKKFEHSVGHEQAKSLAASDACSAPRPLASDKFDEIAQNKAKGNCWALSWIGRARTPRNSFLSAGLQEFQGSPILTSDALAEIAPGAPRTKPHLPPLFYKDENWLTVEVRATEMNGEVFAFKPISRADFTGEGMEQLLVLKSWSPIGAAYSLCEMLILSRKSEKTPLQVAKKLGLGRCG